MDEFTPITTQEQLDAVIQQERDTATKKYAAYEKQIGDLGKTMQTAASKYKDYDKTLAELQGKVAGYEKSAVKMRIAHENGIPYELAARLSGETEDDIRKDAQTLMQYVVKKADPAPLMTTEPPATDKKTAALQALTQQLTNKGD